MMSDTTNENRRKDDARPARALTWTDPAPAAALLTDVMIDIETIGTTPGSAILSIGAVMFGPAGLGEMFYAPIALSSCTAAGLTIDPITVAWWMKQSDAARAAAFHDDAEPLPVALQRFRRWLELADAERPWCHGANFDAPLLEAAYRACGMTPPWKFWDVRDTRTLYELADVKVDRARGVHHNALDDARVQAEAAVIALQRVKDMRGGAGSTSQEQIRTDVLTLPSAIMNINVDPRQSDEYRRGHRDARHEAADLVLARADELLSLAAPSAAAPAAPTDLSHRLRETADQQPGWKSLLTAAADEIERYYGGMMAWKKTAEKMDADWSAERMARIDERCAARAAAPAAEEVREQQECWSANEEDFNATSLDQLLNENDHLKAGDTVWVGVAMHPDPKRLVNENSIIENIAEAAYDIAGEYAEAYPDVSDEQVKELESLVADWIKRTCPPSFWTVENIRPYVLASADFSDDLTRPASTEGGAA